jgi:hypothetical protein
MQIVNENLLNKCDSSGNELADLKENMNNFKFELNKN